MLKRADSEGITLQALFERLAFGGQSWAEVGKVRPQAESLLLRVWSLLVCSALKFRTLFEHQLQTWTNFRSQRRHRAALEPQIASSTAMS